MADPTELSRRDFVLGASATVVAGLGGNAAAEPAVDLSGLSASAAVQHMSQGDIPAEGYARALVERCDAYRSLNAFISFDREQVLADARAADQARRRGIVPGALFGLPIPVKDSVNTRDYVTTAGTPALRGFRPAADAPLVATLRAAGALVLGKTNLHELSYGWTSNNHAFGAVHNPYDRSRIPGGSSGGTAAAIAARLAPLGIAEDTEGSIRVPAALCGIVGFRPTTGRYPTAGCVPITPLFDQIGPHARCVADILLFDAVATGSAAAVPPRTLAGARLGIARDYWYADLDPAVERITERALGRLRDAGATLVETRIDDLERLIDLTTGPIQNHDVRIALRHYLSEFHAGVDFDALVRAASDDIRAVFASDVLPGGRNFVTEEAYRAACDQHLPELRRRFAACFAGQRLDAIVFPATLTGAPRIGEEEVVRIAGRDLPFETAIARNIAPGSTAGLPGLVLPAGLTPEGLPVGLELDGPAGSDRALLALGLAVEQALGPVPAPP